VGGGGATRPFPRDGGVEELHGDPTVRPRLKVWTRGQKMEEVVPKMARRRDSDVEGGSTIPDDWSDPSG